MPNIQAEDLNDLLVTTDKEILRFKFTEIASDLQDYIAVRQLLRQKRVKFQSGTHVQWQAMVSTTGRAKNSALYEVDDVNVGDVMQSAEIPWKHATVNWAIERREMGINRRPRQIVNLLKARRAEAMIDWAALEEENFWGSITAAQKLKPFGVSYWLVRTSGTPGFTGVDHSEFSAGPGGLSSDTYANWANYCGTYVSVTKEDLIRKARKASAFTKFRSPAPGVQDYNTGDKYGYYTTYDNLGNDIASKDGLTLFRRNPVEWVPWLQEHENATDGDVTTDDPFIGINWGVFKCAFLEGEYMNESAWAIKGDQHTVHNKFMDLTRNWFMTDRRRCFVLHKS